MEKQTLKNLTSNQASESQSLFSIHVMAKVISGNWQWFLLSVLLCQAVAWVVLRYTTPEYKISATLLVKDDVKGSDLADPTILQGLGLSTGKSNVDNEVEILKSRTMVESVVEDLQLYVRYFSGGRIKTTEIFDQCPFRLQFINPTPNLLQKEFEMYRISFGVGNIYNIEGTHFSRRGKFGDTLLFPTGRAILLKTGRTAVPRNTYSVRIQRLDPTVKIYKEALTVSSTNKQVSTINLTFTNTLPERGEAILNKHIANYLKTNIAEKNSIADSTIAFIDENLKVVATELAGLEKEIETFRRSHKQAIPEESGNILLENANQMQRGQIEDEVQLKIIETLQAYMDKNPGRVIPASLAIHEAAFTELITRYNELQIARGKALLGTTAQYPQVTNLDEQLEALHENIKNGIQAQKASLKIHISEMKRLGSSYESGIDLIPYKQRVYLNYSRQQQIKQELYIFLLKKRVETSLSKSATIASGRIVDSAKADSAPFRPNNQLAYIVAVLLGLAMPAAFFYIKDLFNNRINSRTELTQLTDVPLLGEIGHFTNTSATALQHREYLTEQFRVLRTNLQHFTNPNEKVILLTSSMGGEGKTFVAINLTKSLSMMNLKVLLMEFDLRKPKIADNLQLNKYGITDYLSADLPIENFIQGSGGEVLFDVLTCGTIPDNPAETILLPKVSEMITTLKNTYDYILLDTAPAGIVADAQLLSRYAQLSIYIVRQHVTYRHQVDEIQDLYLKKKLPQIHLVLNDTELPPGYGYGYYQEKKQGIIAGKFKKPVY